MTPANEHAALVEVIAWIDQNISNIGFSTDERTLIVTACLDVAIEHQAAVATLYSGQLKGSMLALVRILFESVVRGLWLHHCATDAEVARFKRGKIDKEFGAIVSEVETQIGHTNGTLSKLKNTGWKAMNDFTHTGFIQVTRRHSEGNIGGNYPDGEICEALRLSGALGLIAAGVLAEMSDHPELVDAAMQRMKDYASRTEECVPGK